MSETRVGRVEEIPAGQSRSVRAGTRRIAVFNVAGTLRAVEDACGHMKAPLSGGRLAGTTLTCSWHGWQYDVTTGACLNQAHACLRTFAISVRDGEIFVSNEPIGGPDDDPSCDEPDEIPTPVFRS